MTLPVVKSVYHIPATSSAPEQLSEPEKRWVSYQPYLLSKGYQLRPRYRPGWVPSWKDTGLNPYDCEDSVNSLPLRTLDATRLHDNMQVIIKLLVTSNDDREGAEELEILQTLSSEPYASDPQNHTVPCIDAFPSIGEEDGMFYVMPLLRRYDNPSFYCLQEIYDFLMQIHEGLDFLHKNGISHCDISSSNILMDGRALYTEPFHPFNQHLTLDGSRMNPPRYTRSQRRVSYYYIDFGYSKWFRSPEEPRLVIGTRARERTPEQVSGQPYDPFKADIYQLGAVLRRDLIPKYPSLRFLLPLAREMTDHDPDKRPVISQARGGLNMHFAGIPGWKMRWPIMPADMPLGRKCMFALVALAGEIMIFLKRAARLLLLSNY